MPTFEEHRQKCDSAKSVQLILQREDPNEHADWIVITAFYQALHWVDAFFALYDYHPEAHGISYDDEGYVTDPGRNLAVRRHTDLQPICDSYFELYDASIDARYEPYTYQNDPDIVEALLEEDLASIATHINALIDQSRSQA